VLPRAEQVGQRRVPRPTICQNLVFERTSLKKTRFTTSGTSMPVSSMSTEIAMCGLLLVREVVDQALRVLGLEVMTRANSPLRCG
jgi:hypothetical protein